MCALCESWCTLFLTREYKKEHLVLFIWFSVSLSLLFKSLFVLEMHAEDAEGPMLIQNTQFWHVVDKCESRDSVLCF